jgi:hypothetical protein
MSSALDGMVDPLIGPMLALLKDAINADLAAEMIALDLEPEDTVQTTAPHPVPLEIAGQLAMPLLTCFRVQSRSRVATFLHTDHVNLLQFGYLTPATAREQIDERWPLLDRVWRALLRTLANGAHPAHQAGAPVLTNAGVVRISTDSAKKLELFAESGDYAYPMFRGEVEVVWRDASLVDTSALYPALSFTHEFNVNGGSEDGEPDVVSRALTKAGRIAEGLDP